MGVLQQILLASAGALDTQTVTTGGTGVSPNRKRGFITASIGSISNGNSAIYGGAAITEIAWEESGAAANEVVLLKITGASLANSGWTNMTLTPGNVVYIRSSATYSTAGGVTIWNWPDVPFASQPFGTAGSTIIATFT